MLFRNQGSIVDEILLNDGGRDPSFDHELRLGYSRETPLSLVERLRHGPKGLQPRQLMARLKLQGSAERGNATLRRVKTNSDYVNHQFLNQELSRMELADGTKDVVDPEVRAYVSSLVTAVSLALSPCKNCSLTGHVARR